MNDSPAQSFVVRINTRRLARECALRGWSYRDLAHHARLSRPTVSAAAHGRGVRPRTYYRIAKALSTAPALDHALDTLLGDLA